MGQLTITLPDELESNIREYVRNHDYASVSDFIRESVSQSISDIPSYWERVQLVHLLEIKQLLKGEFDEELLDAMRDGYTKWYNKTSNHISPKELSDEGMEFVTDVLWMYDDLQKSYERLKDRDSEIEKSLVFPGFDGNAGDGFLEYLHFLVKHGRYTYVKPLDSGHAPNSHMSVNDMYSRMLSKYKSIKPQKYERKYLTEKEIKEILNEQIHPENR